MSDKKGGFDIGQSSAAHLSESFEYTDRVILSLEKVDYFIKDKRADNPRGKQILHSISGIMTPGLNAIMGPSGGGKTSLLDVLAGRKDPRGFEGKVCVNGNPLPKNFKRISGYVLQHDVATGTLTVRENLMFCANMRLPRSMGMQKKKELVQETLSDLNLSQCADSKVGTQLIRGISGGEKKRACIAIELITQPCVLFLDEPTTGLDASTANSVMILLKKLANRGRTIVFSIHQPRYSIFRLFDKLTLLSQGRLVYHGPSSSSLKYFEDMGYVCHEHNNPPDFFLDVINGDPSALTNSIVTNAALFEVSDSNRLKNVSIAIGMSARFEKSGFHKKTIEELWKINDAAQGGRAAEWFVDVKKYANPFWYQLCILFKRAFMNVIRNPIMLGIVIVVNIVIGLTFGVLFYQQSYSISPATQNRFGVLFFITAQILFASLSSLDLFVSEKEIFAHEYKSGSYMVLPYFLAKMFADLIPVRSLGPLMFSTVTYWMVGLKQTTEAYFTFLAILLLINYAACSIVVFFASLCTQLVVANTFVSLSFVFALLFTGLLLNVDSIVPWLAWIQHVSMARYGYVALVINEFSGEVFTQCKVADATSAVVPTMHCSRFYGKLENGIQYTCIEITGECFLQSQLSIGDGISTISRWEMWRNAGACGGIALLLLILTYIRLSCTKLYT